MSGPTPSRRGARDRDSSRGAETLFIDLGPDAGRDVGPDAGRGERTAGVAERVARPRRPRGANPRHSTRLAAACAVALAATGVFLPGLMPRPATAPGWLEPYPRAPKQAWSVAVSTLVNGPGTSTARFADVPGSAGGRPTSVLPLGRTWVTYVSSDDAVPRLIGLDAETGARRWTYEVRDWGPVRVCADTSTGGALVCVGPAATGSGDMVVLIGLADGHELARHPVSIDASSVAVVGDDVVLGGYDERTREFLAQRINVWTPDRLWAERTKDLEPTVTSVTARARLASSRAARGAG